MRVLLVDDNDAVRLTLSACLEDAGHAVAEAATAQATLAALAADRFDVVLLDLHLPDGLGTALLPEIRRLHPAAKVALFSGSAPAGEVTGVDAVVDKLIEPAELVAQLERLVGG
jgi:CheY-like chemotaxis protein